MKVLFQKPKAAATRERREWMRTKGLGQRTVEMYEWTRLLRDQQLTGDYFLNRFSKALRASLLLNGLEEVSRSTACLME
jgi:hypothetical protein